MLMSANTRITSDAKIAEGPVLLLGCVFNAGSAGNGVILYNDVEANDRNIIVDLEGSPNLTTQFLPPCPIYCERGLYANLDSNTDDVTVFWRAIPEEYQGEFGFN